MSVLAPASARPPRSPLAAPSPPSCALLKLPTYLPDFSSVIITGDFNINMVTPTVPNSAKLQTFIDLRSLLA